LIVTSDPDLLDDVLRVAVRAGTEVEVAPDLPAARQRYSVAPLVLLGVDVLDDRERLRVPPRHSVVIVSRGERDEGLMELAAQLGIEHVISLPAASTWLAERLARRGDDPEAGKVLGVVGGRGGAGASVLAAALCVTAAQSGLRALLVDADPLGGGADLLFGWEEERGLRWPELAQAGGRLDPEAFVAALPNRGDLVVLACDRAVPSTSDGAESLPAEVMTAALAAGRNSRDLVVVDLPRRFDEAAESALKLADRVLVVVPADMRAVAASARVVRSALPHSRELSVVVRGPAAGRMNSAEIAATLQLPLAGQLRPEPRLASALERGEPPGATGRGPLAALCKHLIAEVLT
jgi:secretion/DNA translocation related CpaE-like protein